MKKEDMPHQKVSVSKFDEGKTMQIFERLCIDRKLVVLKNDQSIAVVLSPEEYLRLTESEEEYKLLVEAVRRLEENGGKPTISFEAMLKELMISEEELSKAGDPYI